MGRTAASSVNTPVDGHHSSSRHGDIVKRAQAPSAASGYVASFQEEGLDQLQRALERAIFAWPIMRKQQRLLRLTVSHGSA